MLQLLDAGFVKLDRSIVAAPTNSNARAVLMTMATFASQTGAFVIAEGIEDAKTVDFLGAIADGRHGSDTVIRGSQDMDSTGPPRPFTSGRCPSRAVGAAVLDA